MKVTYPKFYLNQFLHNTLKKFDAGLIASNKYLANGRKFKAVTARSEVFEQWRSGKRILLNEQNSDGKSKDNVFVYYKYSSPYEMGILKENPETVVSQSCNEYISKHLRKGSLMNPGIILSSPFNYLFKEDKMFLIYRVFGIQYYKILEQWENVCDILSFNNQPLMQVESEGPSMSYLLHDFPDNRLSYSRFDNLSQNQEAFSSLNICSGKRYIHDNYQMLTAPKMTHQLRGGKKNYGCRNCSKPQVKPSTTDRVENENRGGLLTCNKGLQNSDVSSNNVGKDNNDDGLLTCKRLGQMIEHEKVEEEKIEKAQKRQELQGSWKDLCKRAQPTKDSVTLARTPWWQRLMNTFCGVRMDDRLQKYLGNTPTPFFRKSLEERRIELGEVSPKSVANWACKTKKKTKLTGDLNIENKK